jgi:outer membrane protein OmpA-like peptidoglycan-associated protein
MCLCSHVAQQKSSQYQFMRMFVIAMILLNIAMMPFCTWAQPENQPSLEYLHPVPHLHKPQFGEEDLSQIKWTKSTNPFETRLSALEREVADLKVMITTLIQSQPSSPVVDLSNTLPLQGEVADIPSTIDIFFDLGSTSINANALMAMNEVIDIAAHYPKYRILLKGFADASGQPQRNQALAQERMQQIRNLLLSSGIHNAQILAQFPDPFCDEIGPHLRKVSIIFVP